MRHGLPENILTSSERQAEPQPNCDFLAILESAACSDDGSLTGRCLTTRMQIICNAIVATTVPGKPAVFRTRHGWNTHH